MQIEKKCILCNKDFYTTPKRIEQNRGKFCSHKCRLNHLHYKVVKGSIRKQKIKKSCLFCAKNFYVHRSRIEDNRGKFCSLICKHKFGHTEETKKRMSEIFKGRPAWNKGKEMPGISGSKNSRWVKRIIEKCKYCNKKIIIRPKQIKIGEGKYCSKKCCSNSKIGTKPWNKGRICLNLRKPKKDKVVGKGGYILIYQPSHPFSCGSNKNYVREHRLIMEQYLGRYLKPEEQIHHINGNKQDNRIENLQLFSSNSEHIKHHAKINPLHGLNKKYL